MDSSEAHTASPPRTLPRALDEAARTLGHAAQNLPLSASRWVEVAQAARTIANGLQNHELRTALGRDTDAIASVGTLMAAALDAAPLEAKMELCRVVGNACFDHDENRKLVLDANIPLSISQLAESVTSSSSPTGQRRSLEIEELRMLRASVGALLNSSLKFDPVRRELARPEILRALLSLVDNRPESSSARPVYFVGAHTQRELFDRASGSDDDRDERLGLGETIAGWTMNVLEDVLAEDNTRFPSEEGIPILASILLSVPFSRSSPASPPKDPVPSLSELSISSSRDSEDEGDEDDESHVDTCIEMLSISAALLEGLTLDRDINKQTLAMTKYPVSSGSSSRTLLYELLDYIEYASPPTAWAKTPAERQRLDKTFEVVKAATVRAVVEAMNDDDVMHAMWKNSSTRNPLVEKLVEWLDRDKTNRQDLMVCASHMLAGLGRSDEYVERMVHEYGLVEPLARIIEARVPAAVEPAPVAKESHGRAGENTQILYGVVSLMRHLAIPLKNRPIVSSARLIPTISRLLAPSLDIVKPLQMSVVGLLKHLTSSDVASSLELLSTQEDGSGAPVERVLALIKRTDEVQLRSESTRILINVVKSLFSTNAGPTVSSGHSEAISQAREAILSNAAVVEAITEQIRLSEKYPVLVNEGIVGLSVLVGGSNGQRGASIVLSSLLLDRTLPLPSNTIESIEGGPDDESSNAVATSRSTPKRTASLSLSPTGDPPTSLDMLVKYLSTALSPTSSSRPSSADVRPEMVSNVCTLLITTIKSAEDEAARSELCRRLSETVTRIERGDEAREGPEWDRVRQGVKVLHAVLEEETK